MSENAPADDAEVSDAEPVSPAQVDAVAAEAEISVAWWAARLALLQQIPSATAPRALVLAEAYAWLTSTTQGHGGSIVIPEARTPRRGG
jgi:hypothetical protein